MYEGARRRRPGLGWLSDRRPFLVYKRLKPGKHRYRNAHQQAQGDKEQSDHQIQGRDRKSRPRIFSYEK